MMTLSRIQIISYYLFSKSYEQAIFVNNLNSIISTIIEYTKSNLKMILSCYHDYLFFRSKNDSKHLALPIVHKHC